MLSETGPLGSLGSLGALGPRRFHIFTVFFDAGAFLRRALLPMVVAVVRVPSAADVILPAIFVVSVAAQVAVWMRRTYSVEGGVLRVDEGVVRRRQRAVPLDRIQQVDVHRTLRHRVLGVATLRVETAGDASSPEIHLHVVGMGEVGELRQLLMAPRQAGRTPSGDDGRRVLVSLSAAEVALAGMTGTHLGVMVTLLFWPLQLLGDLGGNQLEDFDPSTFGAMTATTTQLLLGASLLVPLWLGLAGIASLLRDAGFTLSRHGDEIVVERGLLERREAHMALARVQLIRISQSPLRRPLGLVGVRIQSAGGSGDASRVAIPLVPAAAVDRLLRELIPGSVPLPAMRPPPVAARRRRRIRGVAVGVVASVPFIAAGADAAAWLAAVPVLVAGGWALGGAWYRGLGHALGAGVVVSRQGAVWRRTVVVPAPKVQSARVASSPLQRWAGLATTYLDVAARGPVPAVVDEGAAQAQAVARFAVRS